MPRLFSMLLFASLLTCGQAWTQTPEVDDDGVDIEESVLELQGEIDDAKDAPREGKPLRMLMERFHRGMSGGGGGMGGGMPAPPAAPRMQPPGHAKILRMLQMLRRLGRKLELDAKQRETLKDLAFEARTKLIRHEADMRIAGLGLEHAVRKDPPDFKKAREHADEMSKTFRSITALGIDTAEKAYNTLTPDQKKRLRELAEDRPGRDD